MSFQLCIIKLSGTGSGSFSWLLRNSAAGMQQHQGDTWIKGSKGTELPEAADFPPTRGETTAASSSAPERPLTTGTAGLMTLEATADGAGCQKGREMQEKSSARAGFPAVLVAHQPHQLPPHKELLVHQPPEPPSSSLSLIPPSHFRTFSLPSEPAVSSYRHSTTTRVWAGHTHTLRVLHNSAKTQLSTQHTNPGIMLITKSLIPNTSSSLKIKAIVQEARKRL